MPAILRERSVLMDELGDPDAPIGSRSWSLWLANEIRKTLYDNQQTGSRLRLLVDMFKEHAGWQELGYLTWEDFCAKKLQTDAEKIEAEVVLRTQGRPSKEDKDRNPTINPGERGAAYDMARLNRDNRQLAQRVANGELSPNRAAIEAGFRKQKLILSSNPQVAGRYLAQRVDKEWLMTMVDAYMKAIE